MRGRRSRKPRACGGNSFSLLSATAILWLVGLVYSLVSFIQKGPAKLFEEVSLTDVLTHPIWITTFNESGIGDNEIYQRPLLDIENVTDDLAEVWTTLRVKGSCHIAFAQLYKHHRLNKILIWHNNDWTAADEIPDLKAPLTLIAVPKIKGAAKVEFLLRQLDEDFAFEK